VIIAGIDEAGRGPAIGPLVLAAVWVEAPDGLRALRRRGVRDSKALAPDSRERIAEAVRAVAAHVEIEVATAAIVDTYASRGDLNVLERRMAHAMLERGPAAVRIVADGARLFGPMRSAWPHLRSRDRADATHGAVAAASVVAKVTRDAAFLEIADGCGDLAETARAGMGSVNAATERFLTAYHARHGRLPPQTRRSWDWAPLRRLVDGQIELPVF
jgi:ribonuclease HII